MHSSTTGIRFFAGLLCVFVSPIYAQSSCTEDLQTQLIQAALYGEPDDGYRPLSADEEAEVIDDNDSSESTTEWRPDSQTGNCEKLQSLVNPEDRGYRPLDYGAQGQQGTPSSGSYPAYPQGYGWPHAPYQAPYYPPAYPNAAGHGQPGAAHPYYSQPPMSPGYGVMPYSFGGNGSPPY